MRILFEQVRSRKFAQWAVAYLAAAWLVMQVVEVVSGRWPVPLPLQRAVDIFLAVGFFGALVVAWYHGEKGRQRVSGPELLMLAALLGIAGLLVGLVTPPESAGPDVRGGDGRAATASLIPLRAVLYDNPSVAILPLKNLGSPEDRPFVDGLHDDILAALQKVGGLTVISRTSVERYRAEPKPIPAVADELNVDAVGEGSMSRAGGRIRVTVQLIDGESDAHLWSEQYDRELTAENVFGIRTEIARAVARALKATLTPEEERRVEAEPTASLEASDWVAIGNRRAVEFRPPAEWAAAYRRALEQDSQYAPAWARLSVAYFQMIQRGGAAADVYADSAIWAADRALMIDPELAAAYRAKGVAYFFLGQVQRARELTRRTTELEPGSAAGWNNSANFDVAIGQLPQAMDARRRALRLAPTSIGNWTNLASSYTGLGMYTQAEELLRRALEMDSRNRTVFIEASLLLAYRGDVDSARAYAERSLEVLPVSDAYRRLLWAAHVASWQRDWPGLLAHARKAYQYAPDADLLGFEEHAVQTVLAFGLQMTGRRAEADSLYGRVLDKLRRRVEQGTDWNSVLFELAAIHSALGRREQAAEWLERSYALGFREYRLIELDPMFDNLRGHPRFERVMTRMRADVAEMRRRVMEMEAELEG